MDIYIRPRTAPKYHDSYDRWILADGSDEFSYKSKQMMEIEPHDGYENSQELMHVIDAMIDGELSDLMTPKVPHIFNVLEYELSCSLNGTAWSGYISQAGTKCCLLYLSPHDYETIQETRSEAIRRARKWIS